MDRSINPNRNPIGFGWGLLSFHRTSCSIDPQFYLCLFLCRMLFCILYFGWYSSLIPTRGGDAFMYDILPCITIFQYSKNTHNGKHTIRNCILFLFGNPKNILSLCHLSQLILFFLSHSLNRYYIL
jgi:hypothetical protein